MKSYGSKGWRPGRQHSLCACSKAQKVQYMYTIPNANCGRRKKFGHSFTPQMSLPRTRAGSSRLDAAILRHAAFHGASDSGSDCVCDPCRLHSRGVLPGSWGSMGICRRSFRLSGYILNSVARLRAASGTREPYRDHDLYRSVAPRTVGEVNAARTHDRLP